MGRTRWAAGLAGALLAGAVVRAADPDVRQAQDPPKTLPAKEPKAKEPPKGKEPPPAPPGPAPDPELLARVSDTGGEAPAGSFSRMMGDWIGAYYADQFVRLPGYQVTTTALREPNGVGARTVTNITPATITRARVPVLTRGGFKVAENERVVPEDRAFLTYNFYRDVAGPPVPPSAPRFSVAGGTPGVSQTFAVPTSWDVHRAVIGFETTALDGTASFGVRAPFYNVQGDGSLAGSDFGDLSFVFKGLLWADGADAVSAGLIITAPTGPPIRTVDGDIESTLFQPWVGAVTTAGDFFAMGFSSVVIPTDRRDVTLLFNDVGVGVVVYQAPPGELVTWIAPIAELHVTTPLNHRDDSDLVTVPDLVVLTQGVQVGLGYGSTVAVGVAVPVTGPRPFDWEALVQVNVRY